MHDDDCEHEWLEADGLGGFAMGTARGLRTRRYHGLLQVARRPPSDRTMLVPAVEAFVGSGTERVALSSHHFAPGVVHPDGASRVERFAVEPWPTWTLALPDGSRVVHEIFVPHGQPAVVLCWRLDGGRPRETRLFVRPFVCARDFHALERENADIRTNPVFEAGRVELRPYPAQPSIALLSDGRYVHEPIWYRRFLLPEERARGLDHEEDLLSPGEIELDLSRGSAVLILFAPELAPELAADRRGARVLHEELAERERARRSAFGDPLVRAADDYVVRRAEGRTIIAGYPWFGEWGRDSFVALRGLCLATGRLDDAGAILRQWAGTVSEGMLPNRFTDRGERPEHNAVDAALWYVVACGEYLALRGERIDATERETLVEACLAIVRGYRAGTRYGIGVDPSDGLLRAGVPGLQLTWMDAKVGDRVVTPRIGKPIEVQALWMNALAVAKAFEPALELDLGRAVESFGRRFVLLDRAWFADVADVEHQDGVVDPTLRPNQVLAVGGLPFCPVEPERARAALDEVEAALWTPVGLRTLAPFEPGYAPRYRGNALERDFAYHQGTVWPWLTGPFVEAWLRARGSTAEARDEARRRFLAPLLEHLGRAGLGHVSEIFDAEPPHTARGCPFQAWSVGELLRLRAILEPSKLP